MSFDSLPADCIRVVASHFADPVDIASLTCVSSTCRDGCGTLASDLMRKDFIFNLLEEIGHAKDTMREFTLELASLRFGADFADLNPYTGCVTGYDEATATIEGNYMHISTSKTIWFYPGMAPMTWTIDVFFAPMNIWENPAAALALDLTVQVESDPVFYFRGFVDADGLADVTSDYNTAALQKAYDLHDDARVWQCLQIPSVMDHLMDFYCSEQFLIEFDIPAIFNV